MCWRNWIKLKKNCKTGKAGQNRNKFCKPQKKQQQKKEADKTQNLQAVPTEEGLLPSSNDRKTFEWDTICNDLHEWDTICDDLHEWDTISNDYLDYAAFQVWHDLLLQEQCKGQV